MASSAKSSANGSETITSAWYASVAAAAAISSVALYLLLATRFASQSADIGWHYDVVEFYSTLWGSHEELGKVHRIMADYPPIAHIFGALIGHIVGSPFSGMHAASLAFVGVTYALIFAGAQNRDIVTTVIVYTICLFAFPFFSRDQFIFGNEIRVNFFYAQSAGHATMLAVLFVLAARKRSKTEVLAVPALVFVLCWLYPLCSLQVAGGAIALWMLEVIRCAVSQNGNLRQRSFQLAAMTVLSMAAFRFHPTYSTMRAISDHNGAIAANIRISTLSLVAFFLFVASCALAYLAMRGKSGFVNPLFLAAAGFGASLVFAAHFAVFIVTGAGSEYALLKHAYSIVTLAIVAAACLIGHVMAAPRRYPAQTLMHVCIGFVLIACSSCLAAWMIMAPKSFDISPFLKVQDEVRRLTRHNPKLLGATFSRLSSLSASQNYIITVTDLRVNDDLALPLLIRTKDPTPSEIPFEILDNGQDVRSDCIVYQGDGFRVTHSHCSLGR